jgi:hypothetical protein
MVAHVNGECRPGDAARSTLTVLVYKSGLLSALADNHVINAPIASGAITGGFAAQYRGDGSLG